MKAARTHWAAPAWRTPYKREALRSTAPRLQRWQAGQKKVDLPDWTIRLTDPLHAQGMPSRP